MTVLSRLSLASGYFQSDTFLSWDPSTDTFLSEEFVGRLYPFDRFKTIYHRPTRRETLGVEPGVSVPAGLVIKHVPSDEVFIVTATERYDTDEDTVYDRAYALHRPEFHGRIHRYAVQGSGDDLGPEILQDIGPVYFDQELRADKKEGEAYQSFRGNFFVTYPAGLGIQKGDFLVSDSGRSFRLDVTYLDGGFGLARAEDVAYYKRTFVYRMKQGVSGGYDAATGTYTQPTTVSRQFSATARYRTKEGLNASNTVEQELILYVDKPTVGFQFRLESLLIDGPDTYVINELGDGVDGDQWVIKARRAS